MWDVGIQFQFKSQQILKESQVYFSLILESIYYMKKILQQACQCMLNIIIELIMFQSPFMTKQNKKQLILSEKETFYKMNEVDTFQVTTLNECADNTNHKKDSFCTYATTLERTTQSSNNLPRNIGTWDSDEHPIIVNSATSQTITPLFLDLINPQAYQSQLTGIGTAQITHKGSVCWAVLDIEGKEVFLEDNDCYYSKQAPY